MRRFVFLLFAVWVSVTSGLANSPVLHYESPHTELSYRYALQEEGSNAELWTYRLPTEFGRFQLTIQSEEDRYTVTSDLEGAPSREVVTLAAPSGAGVGEIELAWPDLRIQARYVQHDGPDDLERVAGWTPDCESLANGKLAMTKRELLERVGEDYVRYIEPPRHLEQLVAALHSARFLPLLAGECEDSRAPAAGGCYYDNSGYIECISCCEIHAGISTSICTIALTRICRSGWCIGLSGRVCGGVVNLASNICSVHSCRGKPGDPGCDQSQPCEGQCLNFCGPGWSSGCGHCDDGGPYQQACCQ